MQYAFEEPLLLSLISLLRCHALLHGPTRGGWLGAAVREDHSCCKGNKKMQFVTKFCEFRERDTILKGGSGGGFRIGEGRGNPQGNAPNEGAALSAAKNNYSK